MFNNQLKKWIPLLAISIIILQCSPISRASLEKPKLQNGFEYYSASIDSLNSGAFQSALNLVQEAIKLNPNYAKFYLLQGDVYSNLKNPSQALESYNQAVKLRSSYIEAYLKIADIYINKYQNYQEAIKYYRRSYSVDKSNHQLLLDISNCYLLDGELNLARSKLNEYRNILESSNRKFSFEYFYLSGKLFFINKDFTSAIEKLKQAIDLKPAHIDAKLLLVKCLFQVDNDEKGLEYVNQLLKIDDSIGEFYYYRALYYYKKNKFSDSLGLFEQALDLDGSLLKSHFYLGKIHEALNNKEKSLFHLQKYRESMRQEDHLIDNN